MQLHRDEVIQVIDMTFVSTAILHRYIDFWQGFVVFVNFFFAGGAGVIEGF